MSIIMCVFVFVVTGGSECHADGVNDGSGSSGDGEEAARQSEDDKALFSILHHILYFVSFLHNILYFLSYFVQ